MRAIFGPTINKTAKKRVIEALRRWHTPCQKMRRRPSGNEKGVSNNILFVGINDIGNSGRSTDTVTVLRQFQTV